MASTITDGRVEHSFMFHWFMQSIRITSRPPSREGSGTSWASSDDATSLEPLTHCCNIAILSLFYRYYFNRCLSELAQLVPLTLSWGRSTHYSDRLHDFSVTIPRCYKDVYVNKFFPRTAKLWNFLHTECFPLAYDLNGFKFRSNRHLLTVGSF